MALEKQLSDDVKDQRKPYKPPQVQIYGGFSELTNNVTKAGKDDSGGKGKTKT